MLWKISPRQTHLPQLDFETVSSPIQRFVGFDHKGLGIKLTTQQLVDGPLGQFEGWDNMAPYSLDNVAVPAVVVADRENEDGSTES